MFRYSQFVLEQSKKSQFNYRYFIVGSYTYPTACFFHFCFIFLFLYVESYSLAIMNVFSTLAWMYCIWAHFNGRNISGSIVAIAEVLIHAAVCVVVLGWDVGFQLYLFMMPMLTFFTPWLSTQSKALLCAMYCVIYLLLHHHYAHMEPLVMISPILVLIMYYMNSSAVVLSVALGCYFYENAATNSEESLQREKSKSEEMTVLLKKMFGRYLSADVMTSLISDPTNLELGGEKRDVTIMMTDLRGFTAISERLEPEQVVQLLNSYFEVMVEIVLKYNGTINEFIGDALLVVFGAPNELEDRAERAVCCSIEMQNAMRLVNLENLEKGLPELQMGIGLHETTVVVGNIGSSKRSKYAVVGSGVNMTSRIESYTSGGQILISETMYKKIGALLRIDSEKTVFPKGAKQEFNIYEVGGISGEYQLALEKDSEDWISLPTPIPILYTTIEGKNIGTEREQGWIKRISTSALDIAIGASLPKLTNITFNLKEASNKLKSKDVYGKVLKEIQPEEHIHRVRCTSIPPELDGYFQALHQHF